jgi:hypothetical protein
MLLLERLLGRSTASPLGNSCLVDLTLMSFPGNVRLSHLGWGCLPLLAEQDRELSVFEVWMFLLQFGSLGLAVEQKS